MEPIFSVQSLRINLTLWFVWYMFMCQIVILGNMAHNSFWKITGFFSQIYVFCQCWRKIGWRNSNHHTCIFSSLCVLTGRNKHPKCLQILIGLKNAVKKIKNWGDLLWTTDDVRNDKKGALLYANFLFRFWGPREKREHALFVSWKQILTQGVNTGALHWSTHPVLCSLKEPP